MNRIYMGPSEGTGMKPEEKPVLDRLEICRPCEHFRAGKIVATCGVCGCAVIVKAALPSAHCPIGKW